MVIYLKVHWDGSRKLSLFLALGYSEIWIPFYPGLCRTLWHLPKAYIIYKTSLYKDVIYTLWIAFTLLNGLRLVSPMLILFIKYFVT